MAAPAFLAPPSLWLAAFFLLPMVTMVVFSFWRIDRLQDRRRFHPRTTRSSLGRSTSSVFWRTLKISLYVTVISLLVGYPVAYFLARKVQRFRLMLLMLVILPLWTSYLVRTFAWMLHPRAPTASSTRRCRRLGLARIPVTWLLYSDFAVTLALVHIYMPFLILPLYAVLEKLDPRLLEASRDLGGGPAAHVPHVTLPLSLPGRRHRLPLRLHPVHGLVRHARSFSAGPAAS